MTTRTDSYTQGLTEVQGLLNAATLPLLPGTHWELTRSYTDCSGHEGRLYLAQDGEVSKGEPKPVFLPMDEFTPLAQAFDTVRFPVGSYRTDLPQFQTQSRSGPVLPVFSLGREIWWMFREQGVTWSASGPFVPTLDSVNSEHGAAWAIRRLKLLPSAIQDVYGHGGQELSPAQVTEKTIELLTVGAQERFFEKEHCWLRDQNGAYVPSAGQTTFIHRGYARLMAISFREMGFAQAGDVQSFDLWDRYPEERVRNNLGVVTWRDMTGGRAYFTPALTVAPGQEKAAMYRLLNLPDYADGDVSYSDRDEVTQLGGITKEAGPVRVSTAKAQVMGQEIIAGGRGFFSRIASLVRG